MKAWVQFVQGRPCVGKRLVLVVIPPAGPPVTLPLGWLLPGGLVSLDPGIQVITTWNRYNIFPFLYFWNLAGGGSVLAEPGPEGVQQRDHPLRGHWGGGGVCPHIRHGGRRRGYHAPPTHPGSSAEAIRVVIFFSYGYSKLETPVPVKTLGPQ